MDRTDLHTRWILAVLTLDGHVHESRLRNLFGIVIMLGILQIDQGALLEPDDPNPMQLRILTRIVIFIGTGIDAPSASDTARQVQTIAPEGVRDRFLRADCKLLAVSLLVSLFPFGNESFLLVRGHLEKMLLEEIFLLSFVQERREKKPCQGSKGKATKQLSPGDFLISHVVYPSAVGRRFWFHRFKLRVVGIVAMGAEQIRSFARSSKGASPLPVNTSLPIVIDIAMTFPTESVAMVVTDEFSIVESQFVTISSVVAVETPPHGFSMMEHNILMSLLQFSPLGIDLHGGVAITAGNIPSENGGGGTGNS